MAALASANPSVHTGTNRPTPPVHMRLNIAIEGFMQKKPSHGLSFRRWQLRYFVLYANSVELRYYKSCRESVFGNLPIDERGSIPLEALGAIVVPDSEGSLGTHFALHLGWGAGVAYPRDTRAHPGAHQSPRILWLSAPTPLERAAWIHHISAITGIQPSAHAPHTAPGSAPPLPRAPSPAHWPAQGAAGSAPPMPPVGASSALGFSGSGPSDGSSSRPHSMSSAGSDEFGGSGHIAVARTTSLPPPPFAGQVGGTSTPNGNRGRSNSTSGLRGTGVSGPPPQSSSLGSAAPGPAGQTSWL